MQNEPMKTSSVPMHSSYGIPRGEVGFTPGRPHVLVGNEYIATIRCGEESFTLFGQQSESAARTVAESIIRETRITTVERKEDRGWLWYGADTPERFRSIQSCTNPEISIKIVQHY